MGKHPLPTLKADLLLVHAPAFFDFRDRSDIYFPFLETSGAVPVTPLYECLPPGFKTLQNYLGDAGYDVKLLNLSSVLLKYPEIDFDALIRALDLPLVGIDLHWMVHVQGSLAVAERIKKLRPEIEVVLGGISATYFASELIRYPFVDFVMRGYDTHRPMRALLDELSGGRHLRRVANLLWKSSGEIRDNQVTYRPNILSCGVDWALQPQRPAGRSLPIREVVTTHGAGCAFNCVWCGGSRQAFKNLFGRSIARKAPNELSSEFQTMSRLPNVSHYHLYVNGLYNEPKARLSNLLTHIARAGVKSVNYEQYHLTPEHVLERMMEANPRTTITLSPESHDLNVAKAAGRGVYTNQELEAWLGRALRYGIEQVDIWYFVGMPLQDAKSVQGTVEYCSHLLERFKGTRVNPMICPMIPFLDPGSAAFEEPGRCGYRLLFRSLEDHRRGMLNASIINRINYETQWLTRREIVLLGYGAVKDLMIAKAEQGFLPRAWVERFNEKLEDALAFIEVVHQADSIPDRGTRDRELRILEKEILRRNRAVFSGTVLNQAFPLARQIGGRWFDEMGWEPEVLEQSLQSIPDGGPPAPETSPFRM